MYGTETPLYTVGPSLQIVSPEKLLSAVVWIVFVVWLIYTLVATYHWLRYGSRSPLAIPALALHVFMSLSFALFAVSGF